MGVELVQTNPPNLCNIDTFKNWHNLLFQSGNWENLRLSCPLCNNETQRQSDGLTAHRGLLPWVCQQQLCLLLLLSLVHTLVDYKVCFRRRTRLQKMPLKWRGWLCAKPKKCLNVNVCLEAIQAEKLICTPCHVENIWSV